MRRWAGPAALAALGAVATSCLGGASHHPTLSAKGALAQARREEFVKASLAERLPTYRCADREFEVGSTTSGRYAGYVRPTYQLSIDDSRVRNGPGNVGRIAMLVTVFPDAATAKACAEAGIYLDLHPDPVFRQSARLPRRQIDSATVVIDEHKAGRRGDSFKDDTGQYDIFLSNGRVFAQGLAYNLPHMRIVRGDLDKLVGDIAAS
jgi:hypothetical protein